MSVRYADFQGDVVLLAKQNWQYATVANPVPPAAVNAEMAAVSTALASDNTTHSGVIETRALPLHIGAHQTRFTNALLLKVNIAKGGNLPNPSIIAAIDGVAGVLFAPGVVDVPYVSGLAAHGNPLNVTNGNWAGTPTSYAYQWKSNGVNVGANANSYTTVVGDTGHQVGCIVSATNATGTTAAPISNQVTIT